MTLQLGKCASVVFEIDTGASCNVLHVNTVRKSGLEHLVRNTETKINGVHGIVQKAVGEIVVKCTYKGGVYDCKFLVLNGRKVLNLLGRHDSERLGLIARVGVVKYSETPNKSTHATIAEEFSDILGDKIGCIDVEYEIKLDKTVCPVVHAPRSVPAAIRDSVRAELDRLEKVGIIARVQKPTEWVSSMVVARKKNGSVRICIDPSDLNKAVKREHFPMNTIEDIATRLSGSTIFTTLDANSGYYQIKLSKKSSELTTFNTPFGRYKYLRAPMGLKCIAEVFQREMCRIFSDLPGVEIVVDDILIHGRNVNEHDQRLRNVLQRCRDVNLKLNAAKSKLRCTEVDYVGHKLTKDGLMPTDDRVKSITTLPDPKDHSDLATFLGMAAYVSKFIPNLSSMAEPLRKLHKSKDWYWTEIESNAVSAIKLALTSDRVLKYYDVNQPITVTVDASQKGLGCSILQEDRVISYGSRALTDAETRYAQIELEMLGVLFAFSKFHKLLYGKSNVTVESDHRPLESILSKPIGAAPMRLQKMLLKLQPYDFVLKYKKGKDIGLADCLSRFPTGKASKLLDDELMICKIECVGYNNHDEWLNATHNDEALQLVRKCIIKGWPDDKCGVPDLIKPYWHHRDELSTYNGLVYKGLRLVIPFAKRADMLKLVHKAHQGMTKTKQLARDLIFWPGMCSQIDDVVSKCEHCLKYQYSRQREPMIISEVPSGPWQRLGSDLLELNGRNYLVIVDYFSNFIEVEEMNHTTSKSLIKVFKQNFARHGIPFSLVTDNGPQYVSYEFESFLTSYNVTHITSSPKYPQSNGQSESAVKIIERLINKCVESGDDFYEALLMLRNTPRGMIGSPSERLFGRRTRTLIPTRSELLEPENPTKISEGLSELRAEQKYYYDRHAKPRNEIAPHSAIRMQTNDNGWVPAELIKFDNTPRSQIVRTDKYGHDYRRSNKHIMTTNEKPHQVVTAPAPQNLITSPSHVQNQRNISNQKASQNTPNASPTVNVSPPASPIGNETESEKSNPTGPAIETRGKRVRKQTQFYGHRLW